MYTLTIVCPKISTGVLFLSFFQISYRAAAKKSKKKTAAAISSEDQPPVPPQSGDEADGEFSEGAFNAEETGGDPADSTAATTPAAGPKKPKMKSRTPAKPKPNK